jgi:hypothetical protein
VMRQPDRMHDLAHHGNADGRIPVSCHVAGYVWWPGIWEVSVEAGASHPQATARNSEKSQ